jgi:hypothetical protein
MNESTFLDGFETLADVTIVLTSGLMGSFFILSATVSLLRADGMVFYWIAPGAVLMAITVAQAIVMGKRLDEDR